MLANSTDLLAKMQVKEIFLRYILFSDDDKMVKNLKRALMLEFRSSKMSNTTSWPGGKTRQYCIE